MKYYLLLATLLLISNVACSPASFNGPGAAPAGELAKNDAPPEDCVDPDNCGPTIPPPTTPPPTCEDPNGCENVNNPIDPEGVCDPSNVDRIEVRAESVRLVGANGSEVALAPNQEVITLKSDQKSFQIVMSATLRSSMLKLKLNSEEQVAVLKSGARVVLFTPSQTQDGLKFQISRNKLLESGKQYGVTPHFDFNRSLVAAGNGKCILLPVIHSADLVEEAN